MTYTTASTAPLRFYVFRFKCDTSRAWTTITAGDLTDAYQTLADRGWTVQITAPADRHMCPACTRKRVKT